MTAEKSEAPWLLGATPCSVHGRARLPTGEMDVWQGLGPVGAAGHTGTVGPVPQGGRPLWCAVSRVPSTGRGRHPGVKSLGEESNTQGSYTIFRLSPKESKPFKLYKVCLQPADTHDEGKSPEAWEYHRHKLCTGKPFPLV